MGRGAAAVGLGTPESRERLRGAGAELVCSPDARGVAGDRSGISKPQSWKGHPGGVVGRMKGERPASPPPRFHQLGPSPGGDRLPPSVIHGT